MRPHDRPGIAPAAVAAAAALFIAGHSLTGRNGLEPGISIAAGSAALVLIARLAGLLRENDALRQAVETGEEHFRALSESINDAVLICDLDATVQYASAGALRMYHYTSDELLGRPLNELVHPEDVPQVQAVFTEFLDEQAYRRPRRRAARVVPGARGRRHLAADRVDDLPVQRLGREPARLLVTTRDLSERAALQRQVAHLTFHDGLTGLPNRAYFEERTREVLSRQPSGGKVAVVFVDLDGFTAVNDSEGHASRPGARAGGAAAARERPVGRHGGALGRRRVRRPRAAAAGRR